MQYRTLGRTGLEVSLLSFGTGGPSGFGRANGLTHEDQGKLVTRCLDLGRALGGVPRDSYYLATKWLHHDGQSLSLKEDPAELEQSVDASLTRLHTDYIDVMQFHGLALHHYEEIVNRFYPTMQRMREAGKIRFIGFSEYLRTDAEHEAIIHALSTEPQIWDTIMIKYGILYQQSAREALPLAQEHNVGVLNMAPVRLSLTRPNQLSKLLSEWVTEGVIPKGTLSGPDPLGWLVHNGVKSVVAAGYKFAAGHPAISTVITGTSRNEHLEQNHAALEDPALPEPDMQRLKELFGNYVLPFSP